MGKKMHKAVFWICVLWTGNKCSTHRGLQAHTAPLHASNLNVWHILLQTVLQSYRENTPPCRGTIKWHPESFHLQNCSGVRAPYIHLEVPHMHSLFSSKHSCSCNCLRSKHLNHEKSNLYSFSYVHIIVVWWWENHSHKEFDWHNLWKVLCLT